MQKRKKFKIPVGFWGIIFILPAALFFLCVNVLPMLYAFFLSFHDWNLLSTQKSFILLENYARLLSDPIFFRSLFNTFLYMLISVPLELFCALMIALALNSGIKMVTMFRVAYFIPHITSVIAAGYIWTWLYDPTFGLFNNVLSKIGWFLPFLKSTTMALPSVAIMSVWMKMGFDIIIFLAGLQGIPDTVYEAARIDGTSRFRTFYKITLPLLNPTIVFLAVMSAMRSLKMFGEVFVMTENGGPLNSTRSIVFTIQETSFQSHQMGYGAAMTVVLFLIIVVITFIQMKVLTKKFKY
ncbi:carbohydrate ABC transporter permease [Candidatus Riflebacteria bacterium]